MKLKAMYDPESIGEGKKPRCTHVEVIHTGTEPDQNFSDQMVDVGIAEGWISISGDKLTLKTNGEPLVYTIKRRPGYFCKSSGEAIPVGERAWAKFRFAGDSSLSQAAARQWLAANGGEPNDYDITCAYHCVLASKQHEKFRAVTNVAGNLVAAHTVEA